MSFKLYWLLISPQLGSLLIIVVPLMFQCCCHHLLEPLSSYLIFSILCCCSSALPSEYPFPSISFLTLYWPQASTITWALLVLMMLDTSLIFSLRVLSSSVWIAHHRGGKVEPEPSFIVFPTCFLFQGFHQMFTLIWWNFPFLLPLQFECNLNSYKDNKYIILMYVPPVN